jgi:hypothetical protein
MACVIGIMVQIYPYYLMMKVKWQIIRSFDPANSEITHGSKAPSCQIDQSRQ